MVQMLILIVFVFSEITSSFAQGPRVVYVGSFTGSTISIYSQDNVGNLQPRGTVEAGKTPTWLDIHGGILFTTNEESGAVANFRVNADGSLSFISRQSTSGSSPTHLSIDKTGKFLLAANYDNGSVVVLSILSDGTIGNRVSFSQHTGHGKDPDRQEGPHAHQILLDSTNQFAFSADLGVDKVYQYKFDITTGSLLPNTVSPYVEANPGDGPRHMAFHPSGNYAYLTCELSSVIITFKYDPTTGTLTTLQRLSTLPSPQPNNYPAEVLVLPNGHYVYVSNRGQNTVAVFQVNQENGLLTLIQNQQVGGANPRGLILDDKLRLLYAMNQDTGTVTMLSVNYDSGLLEFRGIVGSNLVTPVTATILQL